MTFAMRASAVIAASMVVTMVSGAVLSTAAAQPGRTAIRVPFESSEPTEITDLCDFTVEVMAHFEGFDVVSVDESGQLTHLFSHTRQTDVYSANGKSLRSNPYTYNLHFGIEDGGIATLHFTGNLIRVPLGQGESFVAAGRVDVLARDEGFVVVPDSGVARNVDAFCAALSG